MTVKNKVVVLLLISALVFTSIYAVVVNGQKEDLERKINVSKMRLTDSLSYNSLIFLFDKVIEQPSKENREALGSALRDKESQLRTYLVLSLSEEEINEIFSTEKGKIGLLSYQLYNAKLLNLDNGKQVDVEIIREMKTAWEEFKQDTGGSPEFMGVKGPFMIAGAFIKLANKMEIAYSKLD